MFTFLSALLYLWNLQTLCAVAKKKTMYKYTDFTVEAFFEYHFSGEGVFWIQLWTFIVVQQRKG